MAGSQKVFLRIVGLIGDSSDPDEMPDRVNVSGRGRLVPTIAAGAGDVAQGPDSLHEIRLIEPVPFEIVDGMLTYNAKPYVWLPVPTGEWMWRITFDQVRVGEQLRELRDFLFPLDAATPAQIADEGYPGVNLAQYGIGAWEPGTVNLTAQAISQITIFLGRASNAAGDAEQSRAAAQQLVTDHTAHTNQVTADLAQTISTFQSQLDVTHDHIHLDVEQADQARADVQWIRDNELIPARDAATGAATTASTKAGQAAQSAQDAASSASSAADAAGAAAGSASAADGHAGRAEAAANEFGLSATSSTLAPGSPATVTVSGEGPAYEVAFGVPQGEKGDKGDKGDVGLQEIGRTETGRAYLIENPVPGLGGGGGDRPVLVTFGGVSDFGNGADGRMPAVNQPEDVTSYAYGTGVLPAGWDSIDVTMLWRQNSPEPGTARWTIYQGTWGPGDNAVRTSPTVFTAPTVEGAGSQNLVNRLPLFTGIAVPEDDDFITFTCLRNGNHVDDTYQNRIGLVGFLVTKSAE